MNNKATGAQDKIQLVVKVCDTSIVLTAVARYYSQSNPKLRMCVLVAGATQAFLTTRLHLCPFFWALELLLALLTHQLCCPDLCCHGGSWRAWLCLHTAQCTNTSATGTSQPRSMVYRVSRAQPVWNCTLRWNEFFFCFSDSQYWWELRNLGLCIWRGILNSYPLANDLCILVMFVKPSLFVKVFMFRQFRILGGLRNGPALRNQGTSYHVPRGDWFDSISCAHYTAEV